MVIPVAVLRVIFEIGSFAHLVPCLLDAVSGSHAVQPVDPITVLMVL